MDIKLFNEALKKYTEKPVPPICLIKIKNNDVISNALKFTKLNLEHHQFTHKFKRKTGHYFNLNLFLFHSNNYEFYNAFRDIKFIKQIDICYTKQLLEYNNLEIIGGYENTNNKENLINCLSKYNLDFNHEIFNQHDYYGHYYYNVVESSFPIIYNIKNID